MSGQGIMCVWQAIAVQDPAHSAVKGVARKSIVQNITAGLAESEGIHYTARSFDDNFPNPHVDFNDYCNYVKVCLRDHSVPLFTVEDLIEQHSWDFCRDAYRLHNCSVDEDEAFKLWQIFNRLCVRGSMPPIMEGDDVQWLGQKIAKCLGKEFELEPNSQFIFVEMLAEIDSTCFKSVTPSEVEQAIGGIHSWLVHEICLTGWMCKRTRKQANWTMWHRRWFILRPGQLTYYTTQSLTERKGDIAIKDSSKLDNLPDYKSLVRRYPARFRITNAPHIEIELSSDDDQTKRVWMVAVREAIEASKLGISPVQAMLAERHKQRKVGHKLISLDEARRRMSTVAALMVRPNSGLGSDAEGEGDTDECDGMLRAEQAVDCQQEPQAMAQDVADITEEPLDEELLDFQDDLNRSESSHHQSFQQMFDKIDQSRKGAIDKQEFNTFLQSLPVSMTEEEAADVFHAIDQDDSGQVTLEDFNHYLITSIFCEDSCDAGSPELRVAFLKDHQDGSGTQAFREFAEFIWQKRWRFCGDKLLNALHKLEEGHRGTQFDQFKAFVGEQQFRKIVVDIEESDSSRTSAESLFNSRYSEKVERLASYLWNRWSAFGIFRLLQESKVAHDTLSGSGTSFFARSNLIDLVCFSELPYITPKYRVVRDFAWLQSSQLGKTGRAMFPSNFDGILPVEYATAEYLRYYGASLADNCQKQVSLLYRQSIQDFTYQNLHIEEYVATKSGGSSLDRHSFAHLDCPLEDHSGFFVLGKIDEDELHLTAFKVPMHQTLYIPGGIIYSKDYLHGMWRTMLLDDQYVDHVHIMRRGRSGGKEDSKKFIFAFEQYI